MSYTVESPMTTVLNQPSTEGNEELSAPIVAQPAPIPQEQPRIDPAITVEDENETKLQELPIAAPQHRCKFHTRRWCCICCSSLMCLIACCIAAACIFYFVFFKKGEPDPLGYCGDCHCIITEPNGTCPTPTPKTDYSSQDIAELASQTALNPFLLGADCNPYYDDMCDTVPPLEYAELGDDAVCGLHYETYVNGNCSKTYKMKSYPSWESAQEAGAFVTHAGACGACSTTQDLAPYLRSPDLTTEGSYCAKQALLEFDLGVTCYQDLGFTESCANIWVYNSLYTAEKCAVRCATTKNDPSNGPPPTCTLNDCLQCDEDYSGPIFKKFAARTRRRSGLLSSITRPCSALVPITQEACPITLPLIE